MNRHLTAAALVCMTLATGCSWPLTQFTLLSTKESAASPAVAESKRVTGRDCVPVVLVHWGEPDLKAAIDSAIESAGPEYDALADGVVTRRYEHFLFGRECWEVEGTAVPRRVAIRD